MIKIFKKAVFLDRDGTLIEDKGYMKATDQIVLLPGVLDALKKLMEMNYELIVITNQSGVGRGLITENDVIRVNNILSETLQFFGISISAFYFCPHHPDVGCECRKPRPGMILRALDEMNIDKKKSYMVGDKLSDAEAGVAAGVTPVLISNNTHMVKNDIVLKFVSLHEFANSIDRTDMN
jgi:D-glycero-D-manno-heptose 1,7-bisphosphate phosphatase